MDNLFSFDTVGKVVCIYAAYKVIKFGIKMVNENQELREYIKRTMTTPDEPKAKDT